MPPTLFLFVFECIVTVPNATVVGKPYSHKCAFTPDLDTTRTTPSPPAFHAVQPAELPVNKESGKHLRRYSVAVSTPREMHIANLQ